MLRNEKRVITYTVIFILCLIVAYKNDGNFIGYMFGVAYFLSLLAALVLAFSVIKERLNMKGRTC